MNLCFQKEKTLRKCVFTTTVIHVYFAPLFPPTCKFAFIQRILLEASVAFDFSGACLLGQPVYNYFDYQYFLSFASDFHFNL